MDKALQKINAQIDRLQQKQKQLKGTMQRMDEVRKIVKLMRDCAITPDDVVAAYNAHGSDRRGTSLERKRKLHDPVAPKYRHPESGQTWSGRGKTPLWLVEEEGRGANRQQFLIISGQQ
ncbi:H-NS family nucleoid-associated regulatory protein [Achromobacter xylosoxidans]